MYLYFFKFKNKSLLPNKGRRVINGYGHVVGMYIEFALDLYLVGWMKSSCISVYSALVIIIISLGLLIHHDEMIMIIIVITESYKQPKIIAVCKGRQVMLVSANNAPYCRIVVWLGRESGLVLNCSSNGSSCSLVFLSGRADKNNGINK